MSMISWIVPLYYFCSFAGLVMVVGGIWLVYKEKIVIDRESGQVTEIETPLGKFKTNIPALVLFALGFVPLIFPIVRSGGFSNQISVRGSVSSDVHPVTVYAVVYTDALQQNGEFSLQVPAPFDRAENYRVVYVAGGLILEEAVDVGDQKSGRIKMPDRVLSDRALSDKVPSAPDAAQYVPELQDVPSEFK